MISLVLSKRGSYGYHKKNPHKWLVCTIYGDLFTIQTLGQRDLSDCFLVHICAFNSSYSSYFAFLCISSKIFRAKMEPKLSITMAKPNWLLLPQKYISLMEFPLLILGYLQRDYIHLFHLSDFHSIYYVLTHF